MLLKTIREKNFDDLINGNDDIIRNGARDDILLAGRRIL
jgi:hypothetical protein